MLIPLAIVSGQNALGSLSLSTSLTPERDCGSFHLCLDIRERRSDPSTFRSSCSIADASLHP